MGFNNICVACQTAINNVVSSISQYAVHPSSDFTRNRQLVTVHGAGRHMGGMA